MGRVPLGPLRPLSVPRTDASDPLAAAPFPFTFSFYLL